MDDLRDFIDPDEGYRDTDWDSHLRIDPRRWVVSKHSTRSEIAQTVLKAALTSSEHMVREHFTYKGVRIFNPHIDIEELVKLLRGGSADAPESIAGENTPLPPDGGRTNEGGHNA
jgi:hypothetical protein